MTVVRLHKRLEALEGRTDPFAELETLSDDELSARIAWLDAQLGDGGIAVPAGFYEWPWPRQRAWFQQTKEEISA